MADRPDGGLRRARVSRNRSRSRIADIGALTTRLEPRSLSFRHDGGAWCLTRLRLLDNARRPGYRTGQLTTIGMALIVTSPARCAARTAAAERSTRGVSFACQVTRLTAHRGV